MIFESRGEGRQFWYCKNKECLGKGYGIDIHDNKMWNEHPWWLNVPTFRRGRSVPGWNGNLLLVKKITIKLCHIFTALQMHANYGTRQTWKSNKKNSLSFLIFITLLSMVSSIESQGPPWGPLLSLPPRQKEPKTPGDAIQFILKHLFICSPVRFESVDSCLSPRKERTSQNSNSTQKTRFYKEFEPV